MAKSLGWLVAWLPGWLDWLAGWPSDVVDGTLNEKCCAAQMCSHLGSQFGSLKFPMWLTIWLSSSTKLKNSFSREGSLKSPTNISSTLFVEQIYDLLLTIFSKHEIVFYRSQNKCCRQFRWTIVDKFVGHFVGHVVRSQR